MKLLKKKSSWLLASLLLLSVGADAKVNLIIPSCSCLRRVV